MHSRNNFVIGNSSSVAPNFPNLPSVLSTAFRSEKRGVPRSSGADTRYFPNGQLLHDLLWCKEIIGAVFLLLILIDGVITVIKRIHSNSSSQNSGFPYKVVWRYFFPLKKCIIKTEQVSPVIQGDYGACLFCCFIGKFSISS